MNFPCQVREGEGGEGREKRGTLGAKAFSSQPGTTLAFELQR